MKSGAGETLKPGTKNMGFQEGKEQKSQRTENKNEKWTLERTKLRLTGSEKEDRPEAMLLRRLMTCMAADRS